MHGTRCKSRAAGHACAVGQRREFAHLLVGAVLPVWKLVTQVSSKAMRVVRCTTDAAETFVGLHLESEEAMQRVVGTVEAVDAAGDDSVEDGMGPAAAAAGPAGDDEDEDEE